jgi:hypothetical protein
MDTDAENTFMGPNGRSKEQNIFWKIHGWDVLKIIKAL